MHCVVCTMGLVVKEFTGPVTVHLRIVTTQMSSNRLEWREVNTLVENNDRTCLQSLSQHHVQNSFSPLIFGNDVHGIHGCTPIGAPHAIQHGLYEYLVDSLMSCIGESNLHKIDDMARLLE